ncbi:MAG: hypothetical protein ACO1RT_00365 [Planctomycetaceae bacterium]
MSDWFERLDRQLQNEAGPVPAHEKLEARQQDLEREKSKWAAKREQEERSHQEKLELLTQAWLHLESEQRRFLQTRDKCHPAAVMNASPATTTATPNSNAVHASVTNEQRPSAAASPACLGHPSPPLRTNDQAIRQFQKLQKEIQSSRGF